MKITWYGHSTFGVKTDKAKILIDPFFFGDEEFVEKHRPGAIKDLTHICLTHGHADHVGDTLAIAKETDATVIGNFDLIMWLQKQGLENVDIGSTGGTVHHDGFSMTWVQAIHSSAQLDEDGTSHNLGHPNGLVFHFDGEKSLYHMGDTDIFGDMALIEELHKPDIGIVPIGDRFTMGGAVAALACQRYFNFKTIIPCHYGSFPIIDQNADKFIAAFDDSSRVTIPKIGQEIEL